MMKNFELEIIRPQESKTIQALWVHVEAAQGSFLVGPGHANVVSILKQGGEFRYKSVVEEECSLKVGEGVFRFTDNKATVLVI